MVGGGVVGGGVVGGGAVVGGAVVGGGAAAAGRAVERAAARGAAAAARRSRRDTEVPGATRAVPGPVGEGVVLAGGAEQRVPVAADRGAGGQVEASSSR